jgi:hypothetical protein
MAKSRSKNRQRSSPVDRSISQIRGAVERGKIAALEAIDRAREQLPTGQYPTLLRWLLQYPQRRHRLFGHAPVRRYRDLGVRRGQTPGRLESELAFWPHLLETNRQGVENFLRWKHQIGAAAAVSNVEKALELLDACEQEIGYSLWGVQLRIALLDESGGLERQRSFAARIAEIAPRSLGAFVAHHASNSNSDACSASLFIDQFGKSLADQRIPKASKTFIQYQLTRTIPASAEVLGELLCVAGTISIPDLCETLLDVCEFVVRTGASAYYGSVNAAIRTIPHSSDPAFVVLEYCTNGDPKQTIEFSEHANISEAIARNDATTLLHLAATEPLENPVELKRIASHLRNYAHEPTPNAVLQERLLVAMIDVYRLGPRLHVAIDDIRSIAMNYGGITLGRFARAITPHYDQPLLMESVGQILTSNVIHPGHSAVIAARAIGTTPSSPKAEPEKHASSPFALELSLLPALLTGNLHEALRICTPASPSGELTNDVWLARTRAVLLWLRHELDPFIETAVSICMTNDSAKYVLPVVKAVSGHNWDFWAQRAGSLTSPIIVSLSLSLSDDNVYRDLLRDLTDEFLESIGCLYPHKLSDLEARFDRRQATYFLREICIPTVLDVCLQFASTKSLWEERLKICSLLASVDPLNKSSYEDEVKAITRSQRITSAMSQLDKSRIYVDEEPLKQLCSRRFGVLFESYMSLRQATNETAAQEFVRALLTALAEKKPLETEHFELPADIGTQILTDLVLSLKDEFLNNSEYGLDSYLSMRIRHGTLTGTLSRPLQEAGVLVNEVSSDVYVMSEDTQTKLAHLQPAVTTRIVDALVDLTRAFESSLSTLKTESLQIWSPTKPKGLFDIRIDTLVLKTFVSDIGSEWTFDDFFNHCIVLYWTLLQAPLKEVRGQIQRLKFQMVEQFDRTREKVAGILDHEPVERAAMTSALNTATTQIQYEMDRVGAWFNPPQNTSSKLTYDVGEIIDISVASVKNLHPRFEPRLKTTITPKTVLVLSQGLPVMTDVLFNIFENICNHSGLDEPGVTLELVVASHQLTVTAINELARKPTKAAVGDLASLQQDIQRADSSKKIKSEGRSGMHKLRRLASKTMDEPVKFEYTSDGSFRVDVTLSVTDLGYPAD